MNKNRGIIFNIVSIIIIALALFYFYLNDNRNLFFLNPNKNNTLLENKLNFDINNIPDDEDKEEGKQEETTNHYDDIFKIDPNAYNNPTFINQLSHNQYTRNFLNNDEQKLYDLLVTNSLKHIASFKIKPIDEDSIYRVYMAFLNDKPEHFWVKHLKYYQSNISQQIVKIEFEYSVDLAERENRQRQIDRVVNEIISQLNQFNNDYTKIKYVHDYIINNTTYDINAPDNQNIYSVFVNRRSVCAGYAKSLQYIMNKIGVYSLYVTGKIKSHDQEEINHAWNIIKLDNQYYHLDITWGDSVFAAVNIEEGYPTYHYFNITTDELLKTHIIDNNFPLPTCNGIKYNYYLKEGLLFNQYNTTVKDKLLHEVISNNQNKKRFFSLKFTDLEQYNRAINLLLAKNGDIFTIIRVANKTVTNKIDTKRVDYYKWDDKFIIDFIINYNK